MYVRGEEHCGTPFSKVRPPYSSTINSETTFRVLSAIGENITVFEVYYVGHLESKERLRIQPAQLFNFS